MAKEKYFYVEKKNEKGEYEPYGVKSIKEALVLPMLLGAACKLVPLGSF